MTSSPKRPIPAAQPHGDLTEIFDDVFFVPGTVSMPGPLPVRFSRNMVVVREDGKLTIINSLRMDERGLEKLEKLGEVAHVLRIAGFHGMDDPFYKDRYAAKVWAVKGNVYASGFDVPPKPEKIYFHADATMDETTKLPISGARIHSFASAKGGEGLVVLDRKGGVIVAGDSLQNWAKTDAYFNVLGKVMMKGMGFIKPHNVGPGWLRAAKPDLDEVRGVLDLPFDHVLPVHGEPVLGGAKDRYRPTLERLGR